MSQRSALLLVPIVIAACSGEGGGGGEFDGGTIDAGSGGDATDEIEDGDVLITASEIEDLYQSTNELHEAHCLCFDDTEECRTDRIMTDSNINCVLDAASEHADVGEYLDCVAVGWDRQGIDCFEMWTCTDEADSPFTCFELPATDCDYSIASEYLEACSFEG
ncbi:MAG: hypothetical protein GY811_08315 [Myxococcales bacterium]|nr:hypothetical protein [Myxococcales bacterium]